MAELSIHPVPTTEEAAAIVAALDAMWPRPGGTEEPDRDLSPNWRFSGRWWRRDRFIDPGRPWG